MDTNTEVNNETPVLDAETVNPVNMKEVWSKCMQQLKESAKPTYEAFLKDSTVELKENKLNIIVSNTFAKEWLETKYFNLIKDTVKAVIGQEMNISFAIRSDQGEEELPEKEISEVKEEETLEVYQGEETISFSLNERYTFDTFVVGASNRFAHAASFSVSENPAKRYNPLFIYGGVGLGKTHLLHAVGHQVMVLHPHLKVFYVSSEKFTNELINSIKMSKTTEFRNKYRNVDVLLIDDIQFLVGKESTQEEFFHTFNELYGANKQIIISSDRPPKEIPTLQDRLRSRFEMGLIADIQPPDLETREAILRKKAELENISVPNEVTSYIAQMIQSNIRELEGALIRVIAYSSMNNVEISLQLAVETLKTIIPSSDLDITKDIPISLIQRVVAEYYGIRVEDLLSTKKDQRISRPRQIAMYITRELTNATLPKIGEEYGGRHHSTVIHACDEIRDNLNDPIINLDIRNVITRIKGYSI